MAGGKIYDAARIFKRGANARDSDVILALLKRTFRSKRGRWEPFVRYPRMISIILSVASIHSSVFLSYFFPHWALSKMNYSSYFYAVRKRARVTLLHHCSSIYALLVSTIDILSLIRFLSKANIFALAYQPSYLSCLFSIFFQFLSFQSLSFAASFTFSGSCVILVLMGLCVPE